jgi:hypothetical protein
MQVTKKLLRVFLVDQQLRGLQTRLTSADRFLREQNNLLSHIESKRVALEGQIRQVAASGADAEGEMKRLDARMAALREQMNAAKNHREYQALLTEINTFKAERDRHEQAALEQMTKADALRAELAQFVSQRDEREKMKAVAIGERESRAQEIKARVEELSAQRATLAADVPKEALSALERLVETRGDEAMASVEVQDRKRHEFTCGACQMTVPADLVNTLMVSGNLTNCRSCGCILYLNEEAEKLMQPAASKR